MDDGRRIWYVWLVVEKRDAVEKIIGKLVRKNWHVFALGNKLQLWSPQSQVTVVSFGVSRTIPLVDDKETDYAMVYTEVKDILDQIKAQYHALIVTEATGCTWSLGNIGAKASHVTDEPDPKKAN